VLSEVLVPLHDPIRLSEAFETAPTEVVRVAKEQSLEGIVAKRKDSFYQPGKRSGSWIKYRINRGQEFVIGGYTPDHPFDALIVGYYEGEKLLYAAKVRNGFVPQIRRDVYRKKRTIWALTREEMKNCIWLRPDLVAQIEFVEWTPDGHLRHSKFVGLRDDKGAESVTRE
jgi:ATP-dependent DNA ligase